MQRKSHKLLYPLAFFIVLLAGLLIAASPNYAQQEEPYPVEVHFADNVTLPQAVQLLQTLHITDTIGQWTWQITYQNHPDLWNGGFFYDLYEPTQPINDQIWRQYVSLVTSTEATSKANIETISQTNKPISPNRQRQYDANHDELTWLEAHISGCWNDNTCPTFPVARITFMATADTHNQLKLSPLVLRAEPILPPPVFFWLKLLNLT
ncbi:MAG: hypothetical protein H6641_16170 [Caldilineaceae bacterium]|nr:hypothetical protein [Caldilineaceae bacterium]